MHSLGLDKRIDYVRMQDTDLVHLC